MRKVSLLLLLVSGCQPERQQETGVAAYLGEWHRAEANCAACDRWVFSRQSGGRWQATRLTTASITDSPVVAHYEARLDGSQILLRHEEDQAKGTITGGRLWLMGKPYEKIR